MDAKTVLATVEITSKMIPLDGLLAFIEDMKTAALNRVMKNIDVVSDLNYVDVTREAELAIAMNTLCNFVAIEEKLRD